MFWTPTKNPCFTMSVYSQSSFSRSTIVELLSRLEAITKSKFLGPFPSMCVVQHVDCFLFLQTFWYFQSDARSIVCPKPIRNVYGHLYSTETISGKQHAVRLLEYVPGARLSDVPAAAPLLYQLGEFVANLDNKLQVRYYTLIMSWYLNYIWFGISL